VVAATRGLDRGRVSPEEVDRAFARDLSDLVQLQQRVRLDYFWDGLLRWQDLFRPLVDASPALRAGGLARWFDNNAFYRTPQLVGRLAPSDGVTMPGPELPRPWVATLPSPYLFSRAIEADADRNRVMGEVAELLLAPAARSAAAAGAAVVHLQEPWIGFYGIESGDWPAFEAALGTIRDGLEARLVLHIAYGDAAPYLGRLRRLPVDAIGVDLVETDYRSLGGEWTVGLVAGCIDARRSLVESVEETAELLRRVAEVARPPVLFAAPSSELAFLPAPIAARKLTVVAEAASRLWEESV
jgi:5-methyltetrahydropteroyltriglutamate--homocysteine methyltransferase